MNHHYYYLFYYLYSTEDEYLCMIYCHFDAQNLLFEKNGISQLMIPTLWCRFYCISLGFGWMHWKFFHIVIVLVWPKHVDFASNRQTEEKRFRNSILPYVWVNTWAIISKYELHFCVRLYAYESESACICICMYSILLKVCAKISINCHVI